MAQYWLAQCNIGRLLAPLDSPQLAGFVGALEPINELADRAPGFVWRLQTEDGDATAIRAFDDDMLIMNMSVWESLDALGEFVYRSPHRDVMRGRRQWFEKLADAYMVLWWIPAETYPTVSDEGATRCAAHARSLARGVHVPLAVSSTGCSQAGRNRPGRRRLVLPDLSCAIAPCARFDTVSEASFANHS